MATEGKSNKYNEEPEWRKLKMSQPIKLGIVGLGRAGWGMHVSELSKKEDKFQIVACCDIIPARVEKTVERCGCRGYDNVDDLIADPEVEMVDIATRTSQHYEHAKKALLAGKNVLLEKPMCMNYAQAAELFSMANQPGKPRLFIRQNRRFEPFYTEVKRIMDSGVLGTVFEVNITQLGYQRRDDWQTLREFGGGQVLNWGPHIIDHSLMLLESEVKEQYGDIRHAVAGGDCEDHFWMHFVGENDRKVNMCISGAAALNEGRKFLVYGNRGAIECHNFHVHVKYIDPEQVLPFVEADPGTPGETFGSTGTFANEVEPKWIEKEYDVPDEDLTVIWDHIYESFRNGAEYPIKEKEVLNMMKAITRLFEDNKLIDSTALRDAL